MNSFKYIFINSILAFVSAFILTTIIHESGHFISYYLFDAQPILYHNYVQTPDQHLSMHIIIISALAGPVISLIQGIIFAMIVARKPDNSAKDLVFLWLSLVGFINFFGYLMLTPISTKGDTGKVAEILQLPYLYRIILAVLGVAVLVFIVIKIGRYFSNFIPNEIELSKKGKYVNALVLFPILAGSMVNVLLAFPIPVILSVIYPATSSYVILCSYGLILRTENVLPQESKIEKKISKFLTIVTLIAVLLNRVLPVGSGF